MNNKILPKSQQTLWGKLAKIKTLSDFYLAGGTAIGLHRGHRESIDFDFFTPKKFSTDEMLKTLAKIGSLSVDQQDESTIVGFLDLIKVSFFQYTYPMLKEPLILDGIRIAELEDLAVMKLIAIAQRGTRKDFIDMEELLTGGGFSLDQIFSLADEKLAGISYNRVHYLKSLTYFEDAEEDPMPKMLKKGSWKAVKSSLTSIVRKYVV